MPFQREAMLLCCFQSKHHDAGRGELEKGKTIRALGRGEQEKGKIIRGASTANVAAATSTADPATTTSITQTPKEQIGSNLYSKEQVIEQ